MPTPQRSFSTLMLLSAIALPAVCGAPASASANTDSAEAAKNATASHQKRYLNESQDRIIKKKSFKAENMPPSAAVPNPELGFFAILPKDKLGALDYAEQLLSNDKVSGLSAAIPWSQLQPAEDKFQWEPVDQLLAACERHHKTLILRVTTCGTELPSGNQQTGQTDAPDWVLLDGVKSVTFHTADGVTHTMPLFWDKSYLAKWSNFVTALANRYDKNPTIQSIGITGGGFGIGTPVVPPESVSQSADGAKGEDLTSTLKTQYGMTQRQLVEHWKYVADVFPKHFTSTRLNFNVNAPARGRWGEDALDEIADYLVYRYGERVYLTRIGGNSGKHSFDDYRLLLKFHHDTLTGMRFSDDLKVPELDKIAKNALDDGISFAELPVSLIDNKDPQVQAALAQLLSHMGYQLINEQAHIDDKVGAGEPLKASFAFVNVGAAPAMRPERNLDKDAPMSYRILVEVRNPEGKPVLQNLHTPPTPTSKWESGKDVSWQEDLKMIDSDKHQLPPGEYSVWMSLIDPNGNRKLQFRHATTDGKSEPADSLDIGKLTITTAVADTKMDNASAGGNAEKH